MNPIVCIFAHPDDEAFGPGGSIAKFASERDVYIICVTNGDSDDQFTGKTGFGKKLGEIRRTELRKSAKILGVKQVEFLNFKDGSLCNNLYRDIAEKLKVKLDRIKPDTILTFENSGIVGHIDHIAVSLISGYLFQKIDYINKLLYWCELDLFLKEIPDYFIYIPPGRNKSEINFTINTEKFWDIKVKAMREHESQKDDADWILNLKKNQPKEEYFLIKSKN